MTSPSSSPKIVIVGAGSLFFGRQAIWALNNLSGFKGATLSLVDTDPEHLRLMQALAEKVAEANDSGVVVEAHTDFRKALPGADFVVLSFSYRNAHFRRIDCEVSAKYGIRMCSGDTIGPGGVFRAARELPKILEICHEVERVCPDAWVINYINPTSIMGIGVMRHTKVKSFALCDAQHMPGKKLSYLKMLGEPESRIDAFDMRIAGVNHFTWLLKAELGGKDVLPRLRDCFAGNAAGEKDQGYSKGRFNNFITAQLTDLFGAIPTVTGHTKEYVPFYQGRAAVQEPIAPLAVFDCDERDERTSDMWKQVRGWVDGKESIESFNTGMRSDHATDIIHTMLTEDGRTYFINRANSNCVDGGGKAVDNLPDDAFLELECRLDRNGPVPLPVGEFPFGLRAQQMLILDVHELTVEGIVQRDKGLLKRALAMDPLVNSIATADAVIDELFALQSDVLGDDWTDSRKAISLRAKSESADQSPQLY